MSKCKDVHFLNASEKCSFVLNTTDCQSSDGYINYIKLVYCNLEEVSLYGDVILLAIWLTMMFLVMALTTNSFFCPALDAVAKSLRLTENVAGVTLLAFGNGAPDIFASLAAFNQDRPELIIGGLFGGGIFDTCIVVGVIILGNKFQIPRGPFLRDVIFYLMASYWAFTIYFKREAHLWDACGFLVMYLAYLTVVILVPMMHKRCCYNTVFRQGYQPIDNNAAVTNDQHYHTLPNTENPTSINTEMTDFRNECMTINDDDDDDWFYHMLENQENDPERAPLLTFGDEDGAGVPNRSWTLLQALSPIDNKTWQDMTWYSTVYAIIKAPVVLILRLTIPVIDKKMPNHNWCRTLNSLHCITGPMFVIFAINHGNDKIAEVVPVWAIVLACGLLLGIIVFCITSPDKRPKYHMIFAFLGFAISNVWVYMIANEIVNILKTTGVILNINSAILGLTVLSWGNNVSDFVANVLMANRGYPAMGMAACFGGPLLNLLVGMGLAFGIPLIRDGNYIQIPYVSDLAVLSGFLFGSLTSTLVAVVVMRFKPNSAYGIYLLLLYIVFITCAILNSLGIFQIR